MRYGRYGHGVATIGKYVYAVAGMNDKGIVRICERYDIDKDKWTQLPKNAAFDEFAIGTSVVATNSRFIYAFGGKNKYRKLPNKELIRRYDNLRPMAGWRVLSLDTTRK